MKREDCVIPESQRAFYDQFHFSPAVKDGDRLFCSGQIGVGADGKVASDPEEQFTLAFEGVSAVLSEAGITWSEVVEITTYHVEMSKHLGSFMKVKNRFVNEPYPAWTAIGVSELAMPGGLAEVRVIARLP
jgi:enamine deaminase RidA (YjgF/YER057c/UK114 family)